MLKYIFIKIFKWYEGEVRAIPTLYLTWAGDTELTSIIHLVLGDSISEILQRILVLILILVSLADHYKKKRIKIFLLFTAITLSIIIIILEILSY